MIIFISIAGYVIACLEGTGVCSQFSDAGLARLVVAGTAELIFEVAGVIKIYRQK